MVSLQAAAAVNISTSGTPRLVKESILYILSPDSEITGKQSLRLIYTIVRTACDRDPSQAPEIASQSIHAISQSSKWTILVMMAASNHTDASKLVRLPSYISVSSTKEYNAHVEAAVRAVFDSKALDHRDPAMLSRVLEAVSLRLVRDLSMQAALSEKLMKSGKWTDSTSLPVESGAIAANLTRDVCDIITRQSLASGFPQETLSRAFDEAQKKCFQAARNDAQKHFDEKVNGPGANGLAAKIARISNYNELKAMRLYDSSSPVVQELFRLKEKKALSSDHAVRNAIALLIGQ